MTHYLTAAQWYPDPQGQYSVSCFPGHLACRSKNCAMTGMLYPISLHLSLCHPETQHLLLHKAFFTPHLGAHLPLLPQHLWGHILSPSWMPPGQEKGPVQPCSGPLCSGLALIGKSVHNYHGGKMGVRTIGLGLRFLSGSVHRLL